jgi:hypothetical protein
VIVRLVTDISREVLISDQVTMKEKYRQFYVVISSDVGVFREESLRTLPGVARQPRLEGKPLGLPVALGVCEVFEQPN